MEKEIEVIFGNDIKCMKEILNKLETEQKILELFETKTIEKIEIRYKKNEPACEATLKD